MEEDSRQILCERCRKFVLLSNIKYVAKGNESRMALCKDCLAKFRVEGERSKAASAEQKLKSNLPSYFCERCRYKFKYNNSSNASLRCPYCGKDDKIIEDKHTSADAILKNAADF